jgi:endonuclease/exonuclease/phosphatase family metal-dependent hydrolase
MPVPPSRRALLRALAAAPIVAVPPAAAGVPGLPGSAGASAPATAAGDPRRVPEWAASRETTVLTRNLALGADLLPLLEDRTVEPTDVYELFDAVRDSGVPERMAAIADEIVSTGPAVVGLQEAALIRRGPGDGPAEDPVVDFLEELVAALEARDATGAGYRVAAASTNADVSLPAASEDGDRITVRLTDRDALLVREDVPVRRTATDQYAVNVTTVVEGRRITATRGFCRADVDVDGVIVRAFSTHLAVSELARRAQAAELVGTVGEHDGPTVVLGDFNTGPYEGRDSAYTRLSHGLVDAWSVVGRGDGSGGGSGADGGGAGGGDAADGGPATCCQAPELDNDRERLRVRLDHVLTSGPVEPLELVQTGGTEDARVAVGDRTLWPSDHAGLFARLRVAPPLSDPTGVVGALL